MKILTIVTVTYNAEDALSVTLNSVFRQTVFDKIEFIVIDGGSTDGTVSILEENKNRIDNLVIEKDHGIFDAMNKGIRQATSPWILFMNAGDTLYDCETIASLNLSDTNANHILYGDCIRVWKNGEEELRKAIPFFKTPNRICSIGICHQAIYTPTQWLKEHEYDWQSFPHCADYKVFYDLWKNGKKFEYQNRPLCYYAYGDGFSSKPQNFKMVFEENARILGLQHSIEYYKCKVKMLLHSFLE